MTERSSSPHAAFCYPSGTRGHRAAHGRRSVGLLTSLLLSMTGLAGGGLVAVALSAGAAPAATTTTTSTGTVAGRVFEDYNANGALDAGSNTAASASATDVGVPGATVAVTDSSGASVGTGTSATDGTFSITVASATTAAVRVEITPPAGFDAGAHGADSAGTVQFVDLGTPAAGTVDVAVSRQGDYTQPNPQIVTAEQVAAIDTTGSLIDPATKPSLISSAYGDRGTTAPTTEATDDQTGTVWGVAQLGTRYAFSAASLRRHAPTGPGGIGAVYLTDLGSGPNATPWVTIPNAGTNPRGNESAYTFQDWFHDIAAFPQVGKIGLGGVAMAPDHSSLYVVNLNDKELYRVPFTLNGSGAPVAGAPVGTALPTGLPGAGGGFGCASDDVRPYGVNTQNGALWVTLTCTGPQPSDLHGYVYRYDPTSGTFGASPAFETDLAGYARGFAFNVAGCNSTCQNAAWNVWPADDTTFPTFPLNNGSHQGRPAVNPEPVVSSVVFDSNGDLSLGVKDRFADQIGFEAGDLTTGDSDTFEDFSAGDILRACGDATSGWTIEHNGTCGTRTGNGAGNGEGPGGGEFYYDNFPGYHDQVALGSLLQLPGYRQVVTTAFDPGSTVRTAGVRFENNITGATDDYHQLVAPVDEAGGGDQGSFSKAGGLGALAALVTAAPVEIGNRVWHDLNHNGTQDAGEPPIAGVTVDLYSPGGATPLATAVTDSAGNYYFSSAPGSTTSSEVYGLDTLQPDTAYTVAVDNTADFTSGGPLAGLTPTTTAAGSDTAIDSNGALVSGTDQASVRTGAAGVDDHTIDFGFVSPTYAVGDFVWTDTDHNGIQDAGEPGVENVTVGLFNADGTPAHHPDGTPVAPVQTDDVGHYSFDFLDAGSYLAHFTTLPTGYVLTTRSATGSTQANDSNPDAGTGITPVFVIGPVGTTANMRAVSAGDDVSAAIAINPTIDAGLIAGPSVSVGDFVWADSNHNGVQDAGEPGINGVTVTLTGPGGGPVTDIFGNPVGPVQTAGNGAYLFGSLPVLAAGQSYATHVDNTQSALTGYLPTLTGKGTPSTDSATASASSGDLTTAGASDLTLDYGFVKPVSVGDFVWVDTNSNGRQDRGEVGIADVVLTLTDTSGRPVTDLNGDAVGPQVTDDQGKYEFIDLPPGQYVVHVDNSQPALSGYLATAPNESDRATDSDTGSSTSLVLASGATDQTLDFGFVVAKSSVVANGAGSASAHSSGSGSGGPSNDSAGLADTGVPVETLIWLALAALFGGGWVSLAARRRRA